MSDQKLTVLLIDDETDFSSLAATFLKNINPSFNIITTTSGQEGLKYFQSSTDVDCIVCDYNMPAMDGLEVLERLRETSEVPFILFTGRGSEEVASDALSLGADDYLQKGGQKSVFEILANRIEQYVEKDQLSKRNYQERLDGQAVLDKVSDAYLSLDEDLVISQLNKYAVELLREVMGECVSKDDLLGEYLWDILPEAQEQFEEAFGLVKETEDPYEFEEFYEETNMWYEIRIFPENNGLSVFVRDITDKKSEEAKQEEEINILVNLYEIASNNSLSTTDRLENAVRLGRDFLGVSFGFITKIQNGQQEIILAENTVENPGLDIGAVCPLDETYCQHVLDQQGPLAVNLASSESSVITKVAYEEFELESYISQKIFVNGEVYGTLCFADFKRRPNKYTQREKAITELLAGWVGYEVERSLTKEALQKQNKRLDAFAGIISHDLRNPLNVAQGYVEIEREENYSENLSRVQDAQERMDEMISELLEFARSTENLNLSDSVSLRSIAQEAWDNIDHHNSDLEVDSTLECRADSGKLLSVFENMFRNSVEHNDAPVTVRVGELSDRLGFYIQDNGVGIPDETDLFSYDKEGQSRFGLLIANEVVEAHGWELTEAKCESGARFEVHF